MFPTYSHTGTRETASHVPQMGAVFPKRAQMLTNPFSLRSSESHIGVRGRSRPWKTTLWYSRLSSTLPDVEEVGHPGACWFERVGGHLGFAAYLRKKEAPGGPRIAATVKVAREKSRHRIVATGNCD